MNARFVAFAVNLLSICLCIDFVQAMCVDGSYCLAQHQQVHLPKALTLSNGIADEIVLQRFTHSFARAARKIARCTKHHTYGSIAPSTT
jgi:hypothetical protein